MHRQPLLDLLAAYTPFGRDDAAARAKIEAFVRAHADCFERTLLSGHVTSSAMIVDCSRTQVLLTHHAKLNLWLQLGGHCDGETDVLASALREAHEESGLSQVTPVEGAVFDVDAHTIPARPGEPEHVHYDVRFLLEADRDESLVVSNESHDLAWVALDNVAGLTTDASVLRMVAKVRARFD